MKLLLSETLSSLARNASYYNPARAQLFSKTGIPLIKTNKPLLVAYWLGYSCESMPLESLPEGIDIVNLYLFSLDEKHLLQTDYVTTGGCSWNKILSGVRQLQSRGVRVVASLISSPDNQLSWNRITSPAAFARGIYDLVVGKWKLDGINIDPHTGRMEAPNERFLEAIKALSMYFGPNSGKDTVLSYSSYILGLDKALLTQTHPLFNHVELMGYFWRFRQMLSQFRQYAAITGSRKLLLGIKPSGSDATPLEDALQLAAWQPEEEQKGGMTAFDINSDRGFQYTLQLIRGLKYLQTV